MITIVSGLPRSGTSMMMRVLEAGGMPIMTDGIRVADADNPNGYYEYERVKTIREDSGWLAQAEGMAIKMVYKLLYVLPSDHAYQVVFMQRALKEVVVSQNRMLARRGCPRDHDVDVHALVESFAAEVAAARRWLRVQANIRVLFVNYNLLLGSPREQMARINAFLGGKMDESAMRRAVDPELYRQRG